MTKGVKNQSSVSSLRFPDQGLEASDATTEAIDKCCGECRISEVHFKQCQIFFYVCKRVLQFWEVFIMRNADGTESQSNKNADSLFPNYGKVLKYHAPTLDTKVNDDC